MVARYVDVNRWNSMRLNLMKAFCIVHLYVKIAINVASRKPKLNIGNIIK